jgi:hypothetical protein
LSLRSEHALQQRVAKALYKAYGGCADGFIGFTYIAITLYTPDIVMLSQEQICKDLHTVTIFEVKVTLKWESLGQLYRYSLYAPTYVVMPINEVEKLRKREYTLFQTLKGLGVGVAAVDVDKEDLSIVLESGKSLAIAEHTLYDAIVWQAFRDLLSTPPPTFLRIYTILVEFLYRGRRRIVNIDEVPVLSNEDRRIIRALVNALSLQKKTLPLAENPLTVELLDTDVLKLSPKEFMKQTLLSKPFAGVVDFISKMMRNLDEVKNPQQCYIPVSLMLLYTKGLPIQLIGMPYDVLCQRIYGDLSNCYKNMVFYLGRE